ncbi:ATP-binding cassette domain-containing protein [Enterobacter mori]
MKWSKPYWKFVTRVRPFATAQGLFHRQTVEAVKPLSFTLREKQTLAIIGENGSGKSTLAKMLARMVEPTDGEVLIDDHPLKFGDYSFRSQRIRMIFQIRLLPSIRASEFRRSWISPRLNTDLGKPEAGRKRIVETLRLVGPLPIM